MYEYLLNTDNIIWWCIVSYTTNFIIGDYVRRSRIYDNKLQRWKKIYIYCHVTKLTIDGEFGASSDRKENLTSYLLVKNMKH